MFFPSKRRMDIQIYIYILDKEQSGQNCQPIKKEIENR